MDALNELYDDNLVELEQHQVDEWWRDRNGHVIHVSEVVRYGFKEGVEGDVDADTVLRGMRVRCPDECPLANDHWGSWLIFCLYENWTRGETKHLIRIDVRKL